MRYVSELLGWNQILPFTGYFTNAEGIFTFMQYAYQSSIIILCTIIGVKRASFSWYLIKKGASFLLILLKQS